MNNISKEQAIRALVTTSVQSFAEGFRTRHESEVDNPNGTINMKIHNVFIATLGQELQYYTALVRSLDSSLGNMLESLAFNIAGLSYEVRKEVEGYLGIQQTRVIAELLDLYKRREKPPSIADYSLLEIPLADSDLQSKRHDSDYYLIDYESGNHYLIELKIGGDLDNKKARSEKEAILEQYAILLNSIGNPQKIHVRFATAYNRFGEDKPWKQERVRQFFSDDELLIGRDFWNFVCKSEIGYALVLETYQANAHYIQSALDAIKSAYLGD